jgi:hypothetical protein
MSALVLEDCEKIADPKALAPGFKLLIIAGKYNNGGRGCEPAPNFERTLGKERPVP